MRKTPTQRLGFLAAPTIDPVEFQAAFERVHAAYPDIPLGYIGSTPTEHYFQERGVEEAYVVPASEGWQPK